MQIQVIKKKDSVPSLRSYLKTEADSTQPSQTQITHLLSPLPPLRTIRILSPMDLPKKPKLMLQMSKSMPYQDEEQYVEHNIWGDEGDIPVGQNQLNKFIPFLELLKYRYEKTTGEPISCSHIIQLAQKLIMRHPQCRLKHIGIRRMQWIDFRDWSQ